MVRLSLINSLFVTFWDLNSFFFLFFNFIAFRWALFISIHVYLWQLLMITRYIFLSMLLHRWRLPFNRFRGEPSSPFSNPFHFRNKSPPLPSSLPPFFSRGEHGEHALRHALRHAFLHSSLLEVRSRKKNWRRRGLNPRPLEWQSSMLTARPRHSPEMIVTLSCLSWPKLK